MLRYFTIIANLFVAVVMTAAAFGNTKIANPLSIGGITANILLVGVVYAVLLSGLETFTGSAWLADVLNHEVTPVLVCLYWLISVRKGQLPKTAPLIWAALPMLYFPYAMLRGHFEGVYAYPFFNIRHIGWAGVLTYAGLMASGILATGFVMLLIDRRGR
jgi:hypothetical protein